MSQVLITKEELDESTLIHYRTRGSKNGERLYQYEDGSLTPLGRIHYGVGQAKDVVKGEVHDFVKIATSKNNIEKAEAKSEKYTARADRAKAKAVWQKNMDSGRNIDDLVKKASKYNEMAEKYKKQAEHLSEIEKKNERTNAEIKKDVEGRIQKFTEEKNAKKAERAEKRAKEEAELKESLKTVRQLTNDELNARIERLQKEKQYAQLLNERAQMEKSPIARMASKLIMEAAENLAKRSLNEVVNKIIEKGKNSGIEKTVPKPSTDNNKNDKSDSNKPDSNKPNNGGGNNRFTKAEKSQIRSMATAGKSIADIAKSLGVTEEKVKGFMNSAGITIN